MSLKELLRKYTPGLFAKLRVVKHCTELSPIVYNCRDYTSSIRIRKLMKIIALPFRVTGFILRKNIPASEREGLAFVLIARNEAPYIQEWLDFHIRQGVTHFIIYDNESTDNFREVLAPYIKSGLVTYSSINGRCRQIDAYNKAVHDYRHKFRYMAFIDADEFMFVRNNTDVGGGLYSFIDDFMTSHKNAGGIGVNWLIFGSSGHETKPEGGVLENFTRCAEKNFAANHHIKTVCDPMKVISVASDHFALYFKKFYNLDENGNIINNTALTQEVHFEKIRINHYFCKSKEEYIRKRNRGMADNNFLRPMKDFTDHDRNECEDTEILSR